MNRTANFCLFAFGKITFKKVDLSEEKEIKNLFEYTKEKWLGLDILINNAGIEDGFLLKDQSYEKYRETMKINMDAPFLCSKYALPLFENFKEGNCKILYNKLNSNFPVTEKK